jgi:hypothetical protein
VTDGDAKLWGLAEVVVYSATHHRFAVSLFEETGLDLREEEFDLLRADITGASAVQLNDDHLDITVWNPGAPERVVRKH